MTSVTDMTKFVQPLDFVTRALEVTSPQDMDDLLQGLPIVSENEKSFDPINPAAGWREGYLHWVPVGRDRGNAGRIKLANQPVNPMAERIVNGMEALIELERSRELAVEPSKSPPKSPRDAALRYFGLPSLDKIPLIQSSTDYKQTWEAARSMARKLRVRLKSTKENDKFRFAVFIEDDGVGQSPTHIHDRLLSLGSSDKGDKPYLIGLFGQGGSSAFAVSKHSSWVASRRAPDLLGGDDSGVGWSVIKQIFPEGRRDPFYAYLAAHPDGRVPTFSAEVADQVGFSHGTRFGHIDYDFSRGGSAVSRMLFQALNHVLYNPILPYELYAARDTGDVMWGHAYRLSRLSRKSATDRPSLDKRYSAQTVYK